MCDFALSLITAAVKSIVKVITATVTKHVIARKKGRTAPLARNGSDLE